MLRKKLRHTIALQKLNIGCQRSGVKCEGKRCAVPFPDAPSASAVHLVIMIDAFFKIDKLSVLQRNSACRNAGYVILRNGNAV